MLVDLSGGVRGAFPACAWRKAVRVNPWGENGDPTRDDFNRTKRSSQIAPWPTCTLAAPRALFVSQYAINGVHVYAVCEDGRLRYERKHSHMQMETPEGLAQIPGRRDLLFVCTCDGSVCFFDLDRDAVVSFTSVDVCPVGFCVGTASARAEGYFGTLLGARRGTAIGPLGGLRGLEHVSLRRRPLHLVARRR